MLAQSPLRGPIVMPAAPGRGLIAGAIMPAVVCRGRCRAPHRAVPANRRRGQLSSSNAYRSKIASPDGVAFASIDGGKLGEAGETAREIAGTPVRYADAPPDAPGRWPTFACWLRYWRGKVVCVGKNYAITSPKCRWRPPAYEPVFLKPSTASVQSPIRLPANITGALRG